MSGILPSAALVISNKWLYSKLDIKHRQDLQLNLCSSMLKVLLEGSGSLAGIPLQILVVTGQQMKR
jgi:hypothetical protein